MGYSERLSCRFGQKPSQLHYIHLKKLLFQYVQYSLTLMSRVPEDSTLTGSFQTFASSEWFSSHVLTWDGGWWSQGLQEPADPERSLCRWDGAGQWGCPSCLFSTLQIDKGRKGNVRKWDFSDMGKEVWDMTNKSQGQEWGSKEDYEWQEVVGDA